MTGSGCTWDVERGGYALLLMPERRAGTGPAIRDSDSCFLKTDG